MAGEEAVGGDGHGAGAGAGNGVGSAAGNTVSEDDDMNDFQEG